MRFFAFAATVLMTGVGSSPALAQNDFDVLLGELKFEDPQPSSVTLTLDAAPQDAANQDAGPQLQPVDVAAEEAERASQAENAREADLRVEAEGARQADADADADETSRAAAEDLPTPAPSAAESVSSPQPLPLQQGMPIIGPSEALPMQEQVTLMGNMPVQACDQPFTCQPHQTPHLPPPSSLLEYMHSPDRYSNVWAGYAQQRQHRHHRSHKHLYGTCKCFEPRGHAIGGCGRLSCSGCTTCDASH